jgi:ribosomal protein S6--L-glutamate ligase
MKLAVLTRLPNYYTEKRLREEAEKKGHDILVVRYSDCHINLTSDAPGVYYKGELLTGLDAIIPRIAPPMVSYGAAVVRQLESEYVYSANGSVALVRSWDKFRALQVLSRAKVTIPQTIFSRDADDVDIVLETLDVPLIVRPAVGYGDGSSVLAETKRAARSVIKAFSVSDKTFLIQEFAQAETGTVRAMVIGSSIVASIKMPSIRDENDSPIPFPLSADQKRIALRASKALGLTVCTVDVGETDAGPVVIDVQPAPSLEIMERTTGKNIAGKIIEYIEINAKRRNKKDKVGA